MSEELNPNWFEVTIPQTLPGTFEEWNKRRESYFVTLRSKISPLIQELKSSSLISSWHILNHAGLDLRLLLRYPQDASKVTPYLRKHGIESDLKPWKREKSKSDEDYFLEFLSEATLQLIDHHDLTRFLLKEGPIHYISNQLGLGNFAEAQLYRVLSHSWFVTYWKKRIGLDKGKQLVKEEFRKFVEKLPS